MSTLAALLLAASLQGATYTGTYYGPGYDGNTTACGSTYRSSGLTAAVGYGSPWWCGDVLDIDGPAGSVQIVVTDRCSGCGLTIIDLSDEANRRACGVPAHTCVVQVTAR